MRRLNILERDRTQNRIPLLLIALPIFLLMKSATPKMAKSPQSLTMY
jgi:hypothetical protein